MSKWQPTEEPFRVSVVSASGRQGHYGWAESSKTFTTIENAQAAFDAAKGRRVTLDRAENAADWCNRGKWVRVASK